MSLYLNAGSLCSNITITSTRLNGVQPFHFLLGLSQRLGTHALSRWFVLFCGMHFTVCKLGGLRHVFCQLKNNAVCDFMSKASDTRPRAV